MQTSTDDKYRSKKSPSFGICCNHGQVQLPEWPDFVEPLCRLLYSQDEDAVHFRANTRTYNSVLQMASTWPPHELNWTMAARAAMKQFAYPAACTIA